MAKPTAKQLRYLRELYYLTGQTGSLPATKTQASREITRLKRLEHSTAQERAQERRAVADDIQRGGAQR